MASADPSLPTARREEFVVERQCRDEGFEIFTPSFFVTTRHARRNTVLLKRLPLLVGYSFVNIELHQFEGLRKKVDTVICILRGTRGPYRFSNVVIDEMMIEDWKGRQEALAARHTLAEDQRHAEIKVLRRSLRQILPKGRAVRVNMVGQADKAIAAMPAKARARVETILAKLKLLTDEPALDQFAQAS